MGVTTTPTVAELAALLSPENTGLHELWCDRLREFCVFIGEGEATYKEIEDATALKPDARRLTFKRLRPVEILLIDEGEKRSGRVTRGTLPDLVRIDRAALEKVVTKPSASRADCPTAEKFSRWIVAFDIGRTKLPTSSRTRLRDAFAKLGDATFSHAKLGSAAATKSPRMTNTLAQRARAAGLIVDAGKGPSERSDAKNVTPLLRFDLTKLGQLTAMPTEAADPYAGLSKKRINLLERLSLNKARKKIPGLTEGQLREVARLLVNIGDTRSVSVATQTAELGFDAWPARKRAKQLKLLRVQQKGGSSADVLTSLWENLNRYRADKDEPDLPLREDGQRPLYERKPLVKRTTRDRDRLLKAATPHWRKLGFEREGEWLNVAALIGGIGDEWKATLNDLAHNWGVSQATICNVLRLGRSLIKATKVIRGPRRGPKRKYRTDWGPIETVVQEHAASQSNGSRRNDAIAAKASANGHDAAAANGDASTAQAAGAESPEPHWDSDQGVLTLGDDRCEIKRQGRNLRLVLDAFQVAGWPPTIDSPFRNQRTNVVDAQTHANTIFKLNGKGLLVFSSTGQGTRISWGKTQRESRTKRL